MSTEGKSIDHEKELRSARRVADLMDRRFLVPGTKFGIGLDGLIGLLPGVGDSVTLVPAAYIVSKAAKLGVPKRVLARMGANIGIDFLVGLVPLVGDLLDFGFKSNTKNVDLLERELAGRPRAVEAEVVDVQGGVRA